MVEGSAKQNYMCACGTGRFGYLAVPDYQITKLNVNHFIHIHNKLQNTINILIQAILSCQYYPKKILTKNVLYLWLIFPSHPVPSKYLEENLYSLESS